jgi:zinc/manganese transport system substrate-binding protein
MRSLLLLCLCCALPNPSAWAKTHVFACEPEWAALAEELGGDAVAVFSATAALQDPHHIQARPSLIAHVRRADLLVCTGAELEIGWLPLLLRRAGNPRIQPGQPGYLEAATAVALLDRPARLDRAEGDIHPQGNPHIQTSPRNIARVAKVLAKHLEQVDPDHADLYRQRLADFQQRWQAAIRRWEAQAAPLHGLPVVIQHRGWVYMDRWLGLQVVATLEPKPGIPPSTHDLVRVLDQLRQSPARAVLRAAYQDPRPAQWLADRAKIPEVVLPFTVGGDERSADLFGLFDDTIDRLLAVVP